jgi:hypothetical protein
MLPLNAVFGLGAMRDCRDLKATEYRIGDD